VRHLLELRAVALRLGRELEVRLGGRAPRGLERLFQPALLAVRVAPRVRELPRARRLLGIQVLGQPQVLAVARRELRPCVSELGLELEGAGAGGRLRGGQRRDLPRGLPRVG